MTLQTKKKVCYFQTHTLRHFIAEQTHIHRERHAHTHLDRGSDCMQRFQYTAEAMIFNLFFTHQTRE